MRCREPYFLFQHDAAYPSNFSVLNYIPLNDLVFPHPSAKSISHTSRIHQYVPPEASYHPFSQHPTCDPYIRRYKHPQPYRNLDNTIIRFQHELNERSSQFNCSRGSFPVPRLGRRHAPERLRKSSILFQRPRRNVQPQKGHDVLVAEMDRATAGE